MAEKSQAGSDAGDLLLKQHALVVVPDAVAV